MLSTADCTLISPRTAFTDYAQNLILHIFVLLLFVTFRVIDCLAVGFLVQMAFSVAAPRARNTLLIELKLLRSTTTLRRKLKTFLFQSAYGHKQIGLSLFCDALSVLENFATASRRYTGDIHYSSVVGLFMTPIGQWKRLDRVMVECTCL